VNETRRHLERTAVTLFVGSALVMAVLCAAIIISGWFAGVIDNRPERVFWAGAILELLMVFVFGAAAFPGGDDDARAIHRVRLLIRLGLAMFAVAPVLCLGALVVNFYT